jgi:hypothetical protein
MPINAPAFHAKAVASAPIVIAVKPSTNVRR